MEAQPAGREFMRVVAAPQRRGEEAVHTIAASAEERAKLAARFDLLALDRLEAEVSLLRLASGLVRLAAAMTADAVQSCTVTLEPVSTRIEERFSLLYGPVAEGPEVVLEGEAETVEPLDGESIDIGEAVAQQLSLALDPFPRAPEADALSASLGSKAGMGSPFAALEDWPKPGRGRG